MRRIILQRHMKEMRGQGNPKLINELLAKKLG